MTEGKSLTIEVVTQDGKPFSLESKASTTIEELKEQIARRSGNEAGLLRLMANGQQLVDGRTLGDYGLLSSFKLHVIIRVRGGGGFAAYDFVNSEKYLGIDRVPVKALRVSEPDDPMDVKPGLYAIGRCAGHSSCPWHGKLSTYILGKGEFDLATCAAERVCRKCSAPMHKEDYAQGDRWGVSGPGWQPVEYQMETRQHTDVKALPSAPGGPDKTWGGVLQDGVEIKGSCKHIKTKWIEVKDGYHNFDPDAGEELTSYISAKITVRAKF